MTSDKCGREEPVEIVSGFLPDDGETGRDTELPAKFSVSSPAALFGAARAVTGHAAFISTLDGIEGGSDTRFERGMKWFRKGMAQSNSGVTMRRRDLLLIPLNNVEGHPGRYGLMRCSTNTRHVHVPRS